jgi:hypothetical protein
MLSVRNASRVSTGSSAAHTRRSEECGRQRCGSHDGAAETVQLSTSPRLHVSTSPRLHVSVPVVLSRGRSEWGTSTLEQSMREGIRNEMHASGSGTVGVRVYRMNVVFIWMVSCS